jgi:hypothetical protein
MVKSGEAEACCGFLQNPDHLFVCKSLALHRFLLVEKP